jgi:hypothetical protein
MGIKNTKKEVKMVVNILQHPKHRDFEKKVLEGAGGVILMRRINGKGQIVSLLRDREGLPLLLVDEKMERVVRDFVKGGYTSPGLEKARAVNKTIMKEVTSLLEYVESYYEIIKTKDD